MSSQNHTVRFHEQDVVLFCQASGDRNPLHISPQYASKTSYGQRVVFGALGALACLGSLEISKAQKIRRLAADFHRPMFLDIEYHVAVKARPEGYLVRLIDGTIPLLTLTVALAGEAQKEKSSSSHGSFFERTEPAQRSLTEIPPGLRVSGKYQADVDLFGRICSKWNIRNPFEAELLLWSSYLVGMELPGRSALFFRLALDFSDATADGHPFAFAAEVQNVNRALSQIRLGVELASSEHESLARGQITSFVRTDVPTDLSLSQGSVRASNAFEGRVALVVGASRGLGAAIARVLALRGAQVVAVSRSRAAFSVPLPDGAEGRISFEQGDATDPAWLDQLRQRLQSCYGRLDFLVCNAFPAVPTLRLEGAAFERLQGYLSQATATVTAPLCAFLGAVNESHGCVVVVSSAAVEKPVREWPHYVAAKCAIEGYASVVPLQYPQARVLIVRPEKLLTEMTNTPMGRQNATPPIDTAIQICDRLEKLSSLRSIEFLHADAAKD